MHRDGDDHIQNFDVGRYILGYTLGNHTLLLRSRVAISDDILPQMKILNTVIP